MSLDKAIEHKKEKRKPYYRSGAFDKTCRPHGYCPYCKNNRLFNQKRKELDAEEEILEYDNKEA
jgi:hypothetical protein